MSEHYHAVAWIDHHEARIIHFNRDEADAEAVHPAHPVRHLHSKAGSPSGTHIREEPVFYRDVATALSSAKAILIVGPSGAKAEFIKYLHTHAPQVLERLEGIETMGKATDGEILAEARRYFARADRMRPQIG